MSLTGGSAGRRERSGRREVAVLLGAPLAKAADHVAALREFGLTTVWMAAPEELGAATVASAVVVAPMLGADGDCGSVGAVAEMFPAALIVALVARITILSVRNAIRCGACTVVDLSEPASEAAETVYQASIGFPRFPAWLLSGISPYSGVVLSPQEVSWLQLLADKGLTMAEIAQRVGWSRAELYRRVRPIYRRLGASNRQEAVARAREYRMLP